MIKAIHFQVIREKAKSTSNWDTSIVSNTSNFCTSLIEFLQFNYSFIISITSLKVMLDMKIGIVFSYFFNVSFASFKWIKISAHKFIKQTVFILLFVVLKHAKYANELAKSFKFISLLIKFNSNKTWSKLYFATETTYDNVWEARMTLLTHVKFA